MSRFSIPLVNKSQGSSASTSLSESPMTLGSLPTNEVSPRADSCSTYDAELEEHFSVKFQLQVQNLQEVLCCNGRRCRAHLRLFHNFLGTSKADTAFAHSEVCAHSFSCLQIHFGDFHQMIRNF